MKECQVPETTDSNKRLTLFFVEYVIHILSLSRLSIVEVIFLSTKDFLAAVSFVSKLLSVYQA